MRKRIALGVFCAALGLSPVVAQAASPDVRQGVSPAPSISEIIQSDPDLRRWNQDPLTWAVAQAVDTELALKPEYAGRPFSERQAEVVRMTRLRLIRLGETDGRGKANKFDMARGVDAWNKMLANPSFAGLPQHLQESIRVGFFFAEVVDKDFDQASLNAARAEWDRATLPRPAPNPESEAVLSGNSRAPLSNDQYAAVRSGIRMLGSFGIGWLLFYMMAKQKNPFKKPEELHKRPKWLLALGAGSMLGWILSSPVTGIAHDDLLGAFLIKAVFFVLAMIPVVIGFLVYKFRIGKAMKNATTSFDPQTRDSK